SVLVLAAFAQPSPASFFSLLGGGFSLATGIGLRQLCPWGRSLAIGGYSLNLLWSLVQMNPVGVLVAGFVLAYLFSRPVKAAFAARKTVPVASAQAES